MHKSSVNEIQTFIQESTPRPSAPSRQVHPVEFAALIHILKLRQEPIKNYAEIGSHTGITIRVVEKFINPEIMFSIDGDPSSDFVNYFKKETKDVKNLFHAKGFRHYNNSEVFLNHALTNKKIDFCFLNDSPDKIEEDFSKILKHCTYASIIAVNNIHSKAGVTFMKKADAFFTSFKISSTSSSQGIGVFLI